MVPLVGWRLVGRFRFWTALLPFVLVFPLLGGGVASASTPYPSVGCVWTFSGSVPTLSGLAVGSTSAFYVESDYQVSCSTTAPAIIHPDGYGVVVNVGGGLCVFDLVGMMSTASVSSFSFSYSWSQYGTSGFSNSVAQFESAAVMECSYVPTFYGAAPASVGEPNPYGFAATYPSTPVSASGSFFGVSSLVSNPVAPCSVLTVDGPSSYVGSAMSYTFTVSSPVDAVAIVPSPTVTYISGDQPSNYFAPYNLPGANSPGSVDTFLESPMTDTFTFPVDLSNSDVGLLSVSGQSLVAWCFDGTAWHDWGELSVLVSNTASSGSATSAASLSHAPTVGSCVSSSGLGLSPSSWVPGLVNMVGCSLQSLFEPSSSQVSSLTSLLGVSSGTPSGSVGASAWLGSLIHFAAVTPAADVTSIKAVADAGGCFANAPSAPSMSVDSQSIGVCQILSAPSTVTNQDASGWLVFLKGLLTVAIYGGAALMLFAWIRRILGGS